ncbi:hypothetical protein POMI540_3586 [Schizosaccharomyces pombe]|uniref:Anaphase-promoting complex subunit 2 n=1 Tax=Schizosaccharomyces pombe (strain 972 / ATCC 24843) TaxID=284812 RepID=APC2_SCHPO|nr:anaphase-promoting complex cullin family subunit Apc2 [Schizosaccharomyces pombe]Q874R3.1 RecName: Full=Anaphase-promoting complex subunit 2; AltName: Full=20S cyclosome/APC complex protein apc2 [Schizosaccharomyces pombe 972h-]CAD62574.1 anaphase-promoting complex cullin family subunit Apc2 [Schizosaccharomyces pombe]|eukprot:NP_001018806.1 anaphase-promoting complex cullin family subunit Apc2 [Schizosaccharomyces pombe]
MNDTDLSTFTGRSLLIDQLSSVTQGTPVLDFIDKLRIHFYTTIRQNLLKIDLKNICSLHDLTDQLSDFWLVYEQSVLESPILSPELDRILTCFRCLCRRYLPISVIESVLTEYLDQVLKVWLESKTNPCLDMEKFFQLCEKFKQLGLSSVLKERFVYVLQLHVGSLLTTRYAMSWEQSVYHEALEWIRTEFGVLVEHVFSLSNPAVLVQLDHLVSQILAHLRSDNILDIVLHYPNSLGAIEDLRLVARQKQQRQYLTETFVKDCTSSILTASSDSSYILLFYVSTIRCFVALDPPGVLLDKAAKPIRSFLNEREDAYKCLVSLLFVDGEKGLRSELSQIPTENIDSTTDRFDNYHWMPDPIDAAPDFKKPTDRDVVGSLISIFKSKEPLVKELQLLLADRLLQLTDYHYEVEAKNIEFLKYRFGETVLQMCSVMLNDIENSRFIDQSIHMENYVSKGLHVTILSRLFWPTLSVRYFHLPGPLKKELDAYAEEYRERKRKRELVFLPNLGSVELEIELEDRTLTLTVTPEQAAFISLFEETSTLHIEKAAELLDQPKEIVERHLKFWLHHRVLTDIGDDRYRVRETEAETATETVLDEIQGVSAVQSEAESSAAEMRVYWSFVVGMLTNLGALELERIHNMLTMFIPPPNGYTRTQSELREFLALMIKEEKLEFTGGAYKLK